MSEESPILSVAEVAKLLGLGEDQVRRWTAAKIIPGYRSGRHIIYHRAEVLDWWQSGQKREPASPSPVAAPVSVDLGALLLRGDVELVITARRRAGGGGRQ